MGGEQVADMKKHTHTRTLTRVRMCACTHAHTCLNAIILTVVAPIKNATKSVTDVTVIDVPWSVEGNKEGESQTWGHAEMNTFFVCEHIRWACICKHCVARTHACTHISHTCVRMHASVRACTHMHTRVRAYKHTHTHTHTRTTGTYALDRSRLVWKRHVFF